MKEIALEQDKILKIKKILRTVAGWIMFVYALMQSIYQVTTIIGCLMILIFMTVTDMYSFFPIVSRFIGLVVIGYVIGSSISLIIICLYMYAGLCMARGRKRGFVTGMVYLLAIISVLAVIASIVWIVLSRSPKGIAIIAVEIVWMVIVGLYVFILHYSWDTFLSEEEEKMLKDRKRAHKTSQEIKVEKTAVKYDKEYAQELERERETVSHMEKVVVPGNGYDFGAISE